MAELKVRDRVAVIDNRDGGVTGYGTIINISDFREPSEKYAIDADFYHEDYLFVEESQLKKVEE